MANSEHSRFVAEALARSRWKDKTRWKEVILEAESFIDCYFAVRAWRGPVSGVPVNITAAAAPTDRSSFGLGYSEQPAILMINPVPEMVERVAAVLWESIFPPFKWGDVQPWRKEEYRRHARAVIEEMREATAEMEEKGGDMLEEHGGDYKDAWRFMIDAALGR